MLFSCDESGGTAFFCANRAVYDHVQRTAMALPPFPKQDELCPKDFAIRVADDYY